MNKWIIAQVLYLSYHKNKIITVADCVYLISCNNMSVIASDNITYLLDTDLHFNI